MNVTQAEAESIRSTIQDAGKEHGENLWKLGEALYKARYGIDAKTKDPLWSTWGYTSWRDYLRTEVYGFVNPPIVYRVVKVYGTFQIKIRTHRKLARTVSVHKLAHLCTLVDEDNVQAWLQFADRHKWHELRDTAKMARAVRALRSDPEKAWTRVQRIGTLPVVSRARSGKNTLILGGLSENQRRTMEWTQAFVQTVKHNHKLSMARCVADALEQFRRLVETGRAGPGWKTSERDLDAAAE